MVIHPFSAMLLGFVEGLTEFLPVSSTGHLILAARWLDLRGDAVKTFEVVIQAGALAAVLGLYRLRVRSMWRGLRGRDPAGRALLMSLVVSFVPAALCGAWLHPLIKARLFQVEPVVAALAIGGVVMVAVAAWLRRTSRASARTLESMSVREALVIGVAQCLALWPGTSRAMVTIVAALLLGFPATVAAEYSFLLALPTLGAATVFDAARGGSIFVHSIGWVSIACGFITSGVVAALAIQGFLRYVTRRGLAPFGWYRIILAALVWSVARRS